MLAAVEAPRGRDERGRGRGFARRAGGGGRRRRKRCEALRDGAGVRGRALEHGERRVGIGGWACALCSERVDGQRVRRRGYVRGHVSRWGEVSSLVLDSRINRVSLPLLLVKALPGKCYLKGY